MPNRLRVWVVAAVTGAVLSLVTATAVWADHAKASPLELHFGAQPVGLTSHDAPIVVMNDGVTPFTITTVTMSGARSSYFFSGPNCEGRVLRPEESCTINVAFRAERAGELSALITVDTDEASSAIQIAVDGNGVNDRAARIAGADRIGTSVLASRDAFPAFASAADAVIARSDAFADALAGTPLAARLRGPLLLTSPFALDNRVRAELQRAVPIGRTVHLLGGTSAISANVEQQIRQAGYNTFRYAGADRYETATLVAEGAGTNVSTIVLATGADFADALSGGAAAARVGGVVLLTAGAQMPPSTTRYVAQRPNVPRVALGGPAAAADPAAERIVGSDRYDTSRRVAERFFTSVPLVGIASGASFPDALSGGANLAAKDRRPLLLTTPNMLHPAIRDYLSARRREVATAVLFGGPASLSEIVRETVEAAIA